MNNNDNCNNIEKIKKQIELNKNVKYCYVQGPTGPQGEKGDKGDKGDSSLTSISVGSTQTVSSDEEAQVINVGTEDNIILNFKIPRGVNGKDGQKGEIGPTGPKGEIGPMGPKGEQGETGICENFIIDDAQTIESTEDASVVDDFENNIHHLTFYIPKGEMGPTGPIGPGAGSTAFNAILYVGYNDTSDSRSLAIKEKIFIPESTNVFNVPNTVTIDINTTGIYEIMLCGKISGVTQANGAKFFLLNTTTGTVINNLSFELKEGTTTDMTFAGTTVTQIFAPASFQLKTSISNDPLSANITFSDIVLTIKRYNI